MALSSYVNIGERHLEFGGEKDAPSAVGCIGPGPERGCPVRYNAGARETAEFLFTGVAQVVWIRN